MTKTKGIAIRLDDKLYSQIEQHQTPRSELIRTAIQHYLNNPTVPIDSNENKNDLSEDLYQEIYNTLYNVEVQPLKDKQFLQDQLHAQTVITASKIPWFQNIKTKLLKSKND